MEVEKERDSTLTIESASKKMLENIKKNGIFTDIQLPERKREDRKMATQQRRPGPPRPPPVVDFTVRLDQDGKTIHVQVFRGQDGFRPAQGVTFRFSGTTQEIGTDQVGSLSQLIVVPSKKDDVKVDVWLRGYNTGVKTVVIPAPTKAGKRSGGKENFEMKQPHPVDVGDYCQFTIELALIADKPRRVEFILFLPDGSAPRIASNRKGIAIFPYLHRKEARARMIHIRARLEGPDGNRHDKWLDLMVPAKSQSFSSILGRVWQQRKP